MLGITNLEEMLAGLKISFIFFKALAGVEAKKKFSAVIAGSQCIYDFIKRRSPLDFLRFPQIRL